MCRDPVAVDTEERVALARIVELVVETCDRTGGVTKCWVLSDVVDALAVDVDGAAIPQALEVRLPGHERRASRLSHAPTLLA